jgi:hypothetical protein
MEKDFDLNAKIRTIMQKENLTENEQKREPSREVGKLKPTDGGQLCSIGCINM